MHREEEEGFDAEMRELEEEERGVYDEWIKAGMRAEERLLRGNEPVIPSQDSPRQRFPREEDGKTGQTGTDPTHHLAHTL